ncbi:MAG: 4-hydroxy-3-methylbut-2-enyl diphosphate reductase [Planctomycetota bacterium]
MQVIRATEMGMCFGVRDALAAARTVHDPADTTIYGELVHNEVVQRELSARGFRHLREDDRDREIGTPAVLITAHGVSDREREALRARGHRLIDTTCPLVAKAHRAALVLAAQGRHVVVLGKKGHVEVRGLCGDLPSWSVVGHLTDVERWPHAMLGVLCQTTMPESDARRLLDAIEAANPHADIVFADTICEPTRQRIRALRELLGQVDVVVVVGGQHSNNTRQLALAVTRAGKRAVQVTGADDVDPHDFEGCTAVGLTAGTSTQDATIDAVEHVLRALTPSVRPAPPSARRSPA